MRISSRAGRSSTADACAGQAAPQHHRRVRVNSGSAVVLPEPVELH
jgi:hypothetical protein